MKEGGISEPSGIVVADVDGAEQVTVVATQALVTFDGETGEELDRLNMVPEADSPLETPLAGASLRIDDEGLLVLDWTPGAGVEAWDVDGNAVVATYAVGVRI